MIESTQKIQAVNNYCKEFLLGHKEMMFNYEIEDVIKEMSGKDNLDFTSDWKYLMILVQTLEIVFEIKSIVIEDNYCRFEFKTLEPIQDKGRTKKQAVFQCCYRALDILWNKPAPVYEFGSEPFANEELTENTEDYNHEGFKETQMKSQLSNLSDYELEAILEITTRDNSEKLLLLNLITTEIEERKSKLPQFLFNSNQLEREFAVAEKLLFNIKNVKIIRYNNFDVSSFDELNKILLKNVAGNYIIYCIWIGSNSQNLSPKYVGHAKSTISRQRIRNHLTKKNARTGAQLEMVKKALERKMSFGLTYLIIEPSYMRTSLEEWIINKNKETLTWNKNK